MSTVVHQWATATGLNLEYSIGDFYVFSWGHSSLVLIVRVPKTWHFMYHCTKCPLECLVYVTSHNDV